MSSEHTVKSYEEELQFLKDSLIKMGSLTESQLSDAMDAVIKVDKDSIDKIIKAGIPVMGHLGLLPQTAKKYSVQGKTEDDAQILLEDSKALEDAGCFTIVYEMVAAETMKKITESVNVPTIGIGCGKHCD